MMPDTAIHAEWMSTWTGSHPELQRQFEAVAGMQDICRRIVDCGRGGDPDALERLRAAVVDCFAKLYVPPGTFGFAADLPLPASWRLPPEIPAALVAAAARCQRASLHFNELVAMIAADSYERLVAAIWGPEASGPPIASLRELRDLWVECGEQAYAQAAHRVDFAAAVAESLAAAVEFCFEQRRLAEAWSRAQQLPTRSEVDAISKRLHLLQRRILELEGGRASHGKQRR